MEDWQSSSGLTFIFLMHLVNRVDRLLSVEVCLAHMIDADIITSPQLLPPGSASVVASVVCQHRTCHFWPDRWNGEGSSSFTCSSKHTSIELIVKAHNPGAWN